MIIFHRYQLHTSLGVHYISGFLWSCGRQFCFFLHVILIVFSAATYVFIKTWTFFRLKRQFTINFPIQKEKIYTLIISFYWSGHTDLYFYACLVQVVNFYFLIGYLFSSKLTSGSILECIIDWWHHNDVKTNFCYLFWFQIFPNVWCQGQSGTEYTLLLGDRIN